MQVRTLKEKLRTTEAELEAAYKRIDKLEDSLAESIDMSRFV
jgi:hypothetical protein